MLLHALEVVKVLVLPLVVQMAVPHVRLRADRMVAPHVRILVELMVVLHVHLLADKTVVLHVLQHVDRMVALLVQDAVDVEIVEINAMVVQDVEGVALIVLEALRVLVERQLRVVAHAMDAVVVLDVVADVKMEQKPHNK